MKVECPRCRTHVEKPASGNPICPTCGFGAPGSGTENAPIAKPEEHLETDRPNIAPQSASTGFASASGVGDSWSTDTATEPKQGMAVTALVLGIVGFLTGLFVIGLALDVAAIIVGAIAASKAKKDPANFGGRGMAITGAVLGAVGLLLTILIWVLLISFAGGLEGFVEDYCADNPDDPNCEDFQSAAIAAGFPPALFALAPVMRPRPAALPQARL